MNIIFHEKLYSDGISARKCKRIKKKVKRYSKTLNIYLVTLPISSSGVLEIYWYPELLQSAYRQLQQTMVVVGLANSREEAFGVIEEIITDVGWESGDIPIRDYFEENI